MTGAFTADSWHTDCQTTQMDFLLSKFARLAKHLQWLALFALLVLSFWAVKAFVPLVRNVFAQATPVSGGANPPAVVPSGPDDNARFKAQDDRITSSLQKLEHDLDTDLTNLKERAQAQQSLITGLTGLTGLYVVILSIAAYSRLQQTKEDSKDSIEGTKTKMADFIQEVRADIPAVRGIARRIEDLLAELDGRLPVDGDWTSQSTFRNLDDQQIQQALIDEMVINSLDIFDMKQDAGNRRTVSRLYVRLGQFYFSKALFWREIERARNASLPVAPVTARLAAQSANDSLACLCRAEIYFDKAITIDDTDPIALRARGVAPQHRAIWKKQDSQASAYDVENLSKSAKYIAESLRADEFEPGALFANAWLLANSASPDYTGALRNLTKLIEHAESLSSTQQRKFVSPAYFNRANYRARILKASKGNSADEFDLLAADLRAAKKCAVGDERKAAYAANVRAEIATGGDLDVAYNASSVVKSAIDEILS